MPSKQLVFSVVKVLLLIGFYYVTSIGLTFYNQNYVRHFNFPLTLTLCHFMAKFVIASVVRTLMMWRGVTGFVHLGWHECFRRILPTAVAGSLDIGLSNWSFEFVTISLYTMTKSSAILFILFFSIVFRIEKPKWSTGALVLLISLGLFLFTYRSSQFNPGGFLLVLSASCISGVRWSLTQLVLQKKEIGLSHPLDMMYHLQPFMTISILPLAIALEGVNFSLSPYFFARELGEPGIETGHAVILLLFGCVLAFFLELAEFLLVQNTSSLTLAISGIVKELCTLLLASFYNNDAISPINWVGVSLCISGISLHAYHKFTQGGSEQQETADTTRYSMEMSDLNNTLSSDVETEEAPLIVNDGIGSNDDDGTVLFSASRHSRRHLSVDNDS